jgi:hypothetical protein
MSGILFIILTCLAGVGFTLFTNYSRGTHREVKPEDPEREHPVAHIKSVLFLEVPLEKIVMVFFAVILLIYSGIWISGASLPELELAMLILSAIIFLLLVFKQILVARIADTFRWRVLVLMLLAGAVTLLVGFRPDLLSQPLLEQAEIYIVTVHLFGLVLGLGGAVVLDVMIFHFLNNFTISNREAVIMHLISQMIILGLILLIVSGAALTLTDPQGYFENPRFLMKMTAVGVVTINGILLNLFVVPRMEQISFQQRESERPDGLISGAFVAGAVSMVSWFSVFILAMINPLESFSYLTLLIAYLVLLGMTIGGGLFTKFLYTRRAEEG